MKNTTVIAYNGGAYGTYLEWALNSLTTKDAIVAPFTTAGNHIGNSHKSLLGKHLLNMDHWREYVQSDCEYPTARLHPKTLKTESLADNLNEIADSCSTVILLYPDRDHELLCLNNFMTKIWNFDNVYCGPLRDVNLSLIYNNFPVSIDTKPKDFPRWIIREHLSYYLINSWRSQVEWFLPDYWAHDRCLIVYVDQLLYNFESTIKNIFGFCNITFKKSVDQLKTFHQDMLDLQIHIDQDALCNNIVDSIVSDKKNISWDSLPLGSEAWIQWQLRNVGFEIQCHDLNCFPTNTADFKKLVYKS
jgi:hypothetical protein